MKFSVLLPTRNRLEYLRYAVETVRRQAYEDWELVISDNCSEEDIGGYARSLNEPRIKYFRTDSFVPVTENWNNALEKSAGDYVIMLGDDDCLMRDYFRTLAQRIDAFDSPDLIYTGASQYAYPGVMPDFPDGYLMTYRYPAFDAVEPFLLDKRTAIELVRQFMRFRVTYGYNMQHALIRRGFIESLREKGPFFQSPYPDYYAMNVAFLKADRILIEPRPLVTIGITPKSYGFFHFNQREKEGIGFLHNMPDADSTRRLERVLLPGSALNTCWLFAIETIRANYGKELALRPAYARYRFLQIVSIYNGYYRGKRVSREEFEELVGRMRPWEKAVYGTSLFAYRTGMRLLSRMRQQRLGPRLAAAVGQFPDPGTRKHVGDYRNILDVFERVDPSHG